MTLKSRAGGPIKLLMAPDEPEKGSIVRRKFRETKLRSGIECKPLSLP